jgi:hypothetical protein
MIALVLEEMRTAACCDIVWRDPVSNPWKALCHLPADLNHFLANVETGVLTFKGLPPGPACRYKLCPDFSGPVRGLPSKYREECPRLDSLFELAEDWDQSPYTAICVDLGPDAFGQIFIVHCSLCCGEPEFHFLASNVTEWLQDMLKYYQP